MSVRQNYNELLQKRSNFIEAAKQEEAKGNLAEAKAQLANAKALEDELDTLNDILQSEEKYAKDKAGVYGTGRRDMEEMGRALMAGEAVKFDVQAVAKNAGMLRMDSTTVATGSIVEPVGADSTIRNAMNRPTTLIDLVQPEILTGMSGYEVPYVVADMAANGSDIATAAGQARTATDPTFRKAKLSPYEVNVTSLVDRNLRRISPANYAAKIQEMAMQSLRRKINALIVNGDGQGTPDMFGITNAKNTDAENIFASVSVGAAIGADTLTSLVYAYGGDEELGGNARLLLSKRNLEAFGKLRGTNEKRKLFEIIPDGPSTGRIVDGGLIVPYVLTSAIGDTTLAYGDPMNYMLGLFGDYSIRVDTSVKAIERMDAILGDVFVGGNLAVHHGFVVGTIA